MNHFDDLYRALMATQPSQSEISLLAALCFNTGHVGIPQDKLRLMMGAPDWKQVVNATMKLERKGFIRVERDNGKRSIKPYHYTVVPPTPKEEY